MLLLQLQFKRADLPREFGGGLGLDVLDGRQSLIRSRGDGVLGTERGGGVNNTMGGAEVEGVI